MQAGRQLDALIAEKVMGWYRIPDSKAHDLNKFGPTYRRLERPKVGCSSGRPDGLVEVTGLLPEFSTDIKAAWEVVEKLDLLNGRFLYRTREQYNWLLPDAQRPMFWAVGEIVANGMTDDMEPIAKGDTAPLAICIAALKAVGAEL